jgi:hypothetical protein
MTLVFMSVPVGGHALPNIQGLSQEASAIILNDSAYEGSTWFSGNLNFIEEASSSGSILSMLTDLSENSLSVEDPSSGVNDQLLDFLVLFLMGSFLIGIAGIIKRNGLKPEKTSHNPSQVKIKHPREALST